MASKQLPTSSSSDANERKRKRKISNREYSRRSRMRKQKHLDELIAQEKQVHEENKKLRQMIDNASQIYLKFSSENNVMRTQGSELTSHLQSLNSVLYIASEVSTMAFDIPDIPETLLELWQLPCHVQPIPASANIFRY